MAASQHKIEVLTNEDQLLSWTAAQFSSFVGTGNVLHDVLFPPVTPPTPAQVEVAAERHKAVFRSIPENSIFIQIRDPSNGKIMGGANWEFWSKDPKRSPNVPVDWIDTSTDYGKHEHAFAQKVMDEFMGRRARDMAMPHGLLHLCYTVPEYERKGVATALVAWGLERVDKEGWTAFTEASPRGWPVYERLGFERIERLVLRYDDLGEYAKGQGDVIWTYMVRPARNKS
ncbi:hypothetical protein LTR64_007924 [Lithohypha guttulata]|uniref:uncharacterized protein n=1 Tax=Lithohypha guttulata TaxID=1690604 RepID=UPI002DDE853B|nr:hypothetical protein LTR51_008208 [Lithohypha guttulata]